MRTIRLISVLVMCFCMPIILSAQDLFVSASMAPGTRNVVVYSIRNISGMRPVYLLKSSVDKTEGRTIVPNGRYDLVALFPNVEDGRRVEECLDASYPEGNRVSLTECISISPGSVYTIYRTISRPGTHLEARLANEDFILFWRVSLRYAFRPDEQFDTEGQWAGLGVFSGALTVLKSESTSQP